MSEEKISPWKCKNCNIYFEPEKPNFSCPKCNGNTTVPAHDFDPEKHVLWEPPKPKKVYCSECGELMASGYIVEKNTPLDLLTIGEGIYWTSDQFGSLGSRLALKAYACPKCGKIEIKIRYIKDKPTIKRIRDKQFNENQSQ